MTPTASTTPRPSIRWATTTRTALRDWSTATGQPGVQLIRDALEAIVANPAGAVATAGTGMAKPAPPVANVPLDAPSDREAWDAAAGALDSVFGGAVGVGAVVRGLVIARLAAEA